MIDDKRSSDSKMFLAVVLFSLFTLLASGGLYWLLREHWGQKAAWVGLVVAVLLFVTIAILVVWLLRDLSAPALG